jgi:Holliday junction resolvase RusA-like endonuclease
MGQTIIEGQPVGKGRPRFVRATGATYTDAKTKAYEQMVRGAYAEQDGTDFGDAPVSVHITACFGVPKSYSKAKRADALAGRIAPSKPDWDNIGKIVCDALNSIAYRDDAQIVDASVVKVFAETPCVIVEVQEVPR